MKKTNKQIVQQLQSDILHLATCCYLKLKCGRELGFTDFSEDLFIDGLNYCSSSGFLPSAIVHNSSLAEDNVEIEGVIADEFITHADIIAGKYDHAEISLFLVDYTNLSLGKMHLKYGWFAEVLLKNNSFVVNVQGLHQALYKSVGEIYSPRCRAKFGDERCGLDLANYTHLGEVAEVVNNTAFISNLHTQKDDYFRGGMIKFLSGKNQGLKREIKYNRAGRIVFCLPFPYKINTGESYELVAGCDKQFVTCRQFDNCVNFRGEPHIPGLQKLIDSNCN